MKRWHEDFHVSFREWKKHHRGHIESNIQQPIIYENGVAVGLRRDVWDVDCVCDTQVGRFRKIDAYDCGKPRCLMCHGDKFWKRYETYQEWCSSLKLREGIEELAT